MEDMTEMTANLAGKTLEPKVYSLVVKTSRMAILHMGVYYSLDEAFAAVKLRAMEEHKTKDPTKLSLDMWMWEAMPATSVLSKFFGKDFQNQTLVMEEAKMEQLPSAALTASEYVRQVYDMKNDLMKKIIADKDVAALDEAKSFLSKAEQRLIREKIIPNEKIDAKIT